MARPEPTAPLRVERLETDRLPVVYQRAPAGARSFAATFLAPAGFGHDPAPVRGVGRLTASLLTTATERRTKVELARALDRLGATLSAHADPDDAEVTVGGPHDRWEELLGLLAEVVRRPRFAREDRQRVLRQMTEVRLREATQPGERADKELLASVFPRGHPYRETGLGTSTTAGRIDDRTIRRFHAAHYLAPGAQLVVTAGVAPSRVLRVTAPLFPGVSGPDLPTAPPRRPSRPARSETHIRMPRQTQVEVRVGGSSIARDDPSFPAAFLANEVLGGRPLLSRLFQTVREREGLAYHASSDLEALRLGGYWAAQAGTGSDRWKPTVRLLQEQLRRLREETVRPRELETIRTSAIGELPLTLETTATAHHLALEVARFRLPEDYFLTWADRLRAVRPRELREAASSAFSADGATTVLVGPLDGSSRR